MKSDPSGQSAGENPSQAAKPTDLAEADFNPTNFTAEILGKWNGPGTLPENVEIVGKKLVLWRSAKTILNDQSEDFQHKLLCDGLVFNCGDLCAFGCTYCYDEAVMRKLVTPFIEAYNKQNGTDFKIEDFSVRRRNAIEVLKGQLTNPDGTPKFLDPKDTRVVYSSTVVDVAATMDILKETAAACILILELTNWQIRLLSKSVLLKLLIEREMIPKKYWPRLILGFSIGTLDDKLAKAIEVGTSPPSKRIEALRWLQDQDIRTFGMICPSLPQENYDQFSKDCCEAIRVEKCEHLWAEPINSRGTSLDSTVKALRDAGYDADADRLESVSKGPESAKNWEAYARGTFEAHAKRVPAGKLRFLQYVDDDSADWWANQRQRGAVPIGKVAMTRLILAGGQSAPGKKLRKLSAADQKYRDEREQLVTAGYKASIAAAIALYEIWAYKDGALWEKEFGSFEYYCKLKWGYEKSHCYRLINAGRFLNSLVESAPPVDGDQAEDSSDDPKPVIKMPMNEAQIRALTDTVGHDRSVEVWNRITQDHEPEKLTGAWVKQLAESELRKIKKEEGIPAAPKAGPTQKEREHSKSSRAWKRAQEQFERLQLTLATLMKLDPLQPHLAEIKGIIHRHVQGGIIDVEAVDATPASEAVDAPTMPVHTPSTPAEDEVPAETTKPGKKPGKAGTRKPKTAKPVDAA